MNVLQEIGYSYAKLEYPELTYEDYEEGDFGGDNDYSYVVNEILEWDVKRGFGGAIVKKWIKDNNVSVIESETGGEGAGEYCYMIFSWREKVYKIEFSYYSYHGNDFDDVESTIREVKPVERVVTVYEDIK